MSSVLGLAFAACLTAMLDPFAAGYSPGADQVLEGVLQSGTDRLPNLAIGDKTLHLKSDDEKIAATLRDERLSGRELRVVGSAGKDGSFNVRDFFVIRDGKPYKIIYFCEICNITTFSPGNCLCCQRPTVPVEVSPTDPRIYHDEIKGPPAAPGPDK